MAYRRKLVVGGGQNDVLAVGALRVPALPAVDPALNTSAYGKIKRFYADV